jgi:branched-chain amino acid transport system ATP-binding protein
LAAVTLLETKGLSREFGGLHAVENVDLALEQGEIRAIIGPNGAGKSTLVSMICGRLRPSRGSIRFDGRDITAMPSWRRVGLGIVYTFQITSVFRDLTCFENVALAAQSEMMRRLGWRVDGSTLAARTHGALKRVGLDPLAQTRAARLSYGHQRLLEVAMGMALEPKLLIMDEPTQGLADSEIAEFCRLVRQLAEGATVLLIEHNMPVVMELAHRITVMNAGSVLAQGTPEEVRASPAVRAAYLGS